MKYYVVSDIHNYFTELKIALEAKGFFEDNEPHKLIICGDLFDRGQEALKLQDFIVDLMEKDMVILIRGNHEDLMLDLLQELCQSAYIYTHHIQNGTVDTIRQLLSDKNYKNPTELYKEIKATPFCSKIIPAMKNYYETQNFIFVHGWIPGKGPYEYDPKWRRASKKRWDEARWINGIEAASRGLIVPDKTVVCGHWGTSFGHRMKSNFSRYEDEKNHAPYYDTGIIAIDATTALSGIVNCIVIEDDEL